ncbi:MAG: DegT/DnrJ/EryC1/StrS family aminotransferase [Planctomycetes bacterium]|nr:DegT/DnrJ/EryC1/StrS family aminotransferase [Planctomycetota bacterium]
MSIPVNEPSLSGNEEKYLRECISTGWISSEGPFVERFEHEFAAYIGVKYGVAVCNGTAALETAISACLPEPGEIIMPAFTIISCAIAAIRAGHKPVLVDIDPHTWTMDVQQIPSRINARTRAILPVHIYGHPVDMDPLMDIARAHNLQVIEDASEVHGAEYKGRKAGGLSQASAFSFYANKIITTGEGGMVLSDDSTIATRARKFRNLFFEPNRRFLHEELGYNFRMTNMQAAIGCAQLERIEEILARKRRLGQLYRERLSELPDLQLQIEREWAKQVYWMYSVQLPERYGLTAADVMTQLQKRAIGCRPFFEGLHQQPALKRMGFFQWENYPVTEQASRMGFYLPSGTALSEGQVHESCDRLIEILKAGLR